jgi:hypothetical protein
MCQRKRRRRRRRRRGKTSWTDYVTNEGYYYRQSRKKVTSYVQYIEGRIGHIWHKYCHLEQVIEGNRR